MLELLVRYAKDRGLDVEPGFKPKDVRWAIAFDGNGRFLEVLELGDVGSKKNPGRTFSKCSDLSHSEMISGKAGSTKSHFLVETAEVVALYDPRADDEHHLTNDQKAKAKHNYFVKLLEDAGKEMPQLQILAKSTSEGDTLVAIRERLRAQKVRRTEKVTFRVADTFPVESDAWHGWWRTFRKNLAEAAAKTQHRGAPTPKNAEKEKRGQESTSLMRCFATGELGRPAATHPKIEKLTDVGGMPSGDVLIGFDKESFRSYGLKKSANAAVSEQAAAIYRTALNDIIKSHGQRLGGAKVVHWFKEKVVEDDDPLSWLVEGAEQEQLGAQERARKLLNSIRTGDRQDLLDNQYYALTLSGASGRIMVRDWMEGQFEELASNICRWFDDLSIIRRDGSAPARPPKFLAVLGATVRDLDDLSSPLVSKMWRAAVRAEPVPLSALAQALIRARADIITDEPLNHARMGLMKSYHIRKNRQMGGSEMAEELKSALNEGHPHSAYQCGRLMAVLAQLQRSALGDVGAGVVQRYYAAASSTPALVLGRVTRLSQFHLNKLDPGLAHWYETRIADIWSHIKGGPPRTLDLEEQSLFALGYYQQIAHMRAEKPTKSGNEEGEKDE